MEKYLLIIGSVIIVIIIIIIIIFSYNSKGYDAENKEIDEKLVLGQLINDKINLQYIPNFFTEQECDHIISLAGDKFTRSKVIESTNDVENSNRTSKSFYIDRGSTDIIKNIEQRVAKLTNRDLSYVEGMQVVMYTPGDEFNQHFDWFHEDYRKKVNNQRLYTFFVYLSDVKGEGGETHFPKLNIKFKPKKGDAIFFQNCTNIDKCFDESLHAGLPTKDEVKKGLNIWIRIKPI